MKEETILIYREFESGQLESLFKMAVELLRAFGALALQRFSALRESWF